MVEDRACTGTRLRDLRALRRSQDKEKEEVQKRRDDGVSEQQRVAVEEDESAGLEAKRAARRAKRQRKRARRAAAAEAAASAAASAQILGEAAGSGQMTASGGTHGPGEAAPSKGATFQPVSTESGFKPYFLEHPVTYISFGFEGRYDGSGEIRECGITVTRVDEDALRGFRYNPTQLPESTKSYCFRISDFISDPIPPWAWKKGLEVKKFRLGTQKVTCVRRVNLNSEMTKIVDEEKARNVPIRLVVHCRENEDVCCTKNKISAFKGLWGEVIDTQIAWRHLDPIQKKPDLANLTDYFLRREGDRELDSSMVHNAGNNSYLTMLLVGRLIDCALSS